MRSKIFVQEYRTAFGTLLIGDFQGKLCLCDWKYRSKRLQIDRRIQKGLNADYVHKGTKVIEEAQEQLKAYFLGNLQKFDIPICYVGSDFQKSVWCRLCSIPYGTTKSYLDLASEMDNTKAVRAVASANGANAIAIVVPCHRIIGSNGQLVGYAGGLRSKRGLLSLEAQEKEQLRFNF